MWFPTFIGACAPIQKIISLVMRPLQDKHHLHTIVLKHDWHETVFAEKGIDLLVTCPSLYLEVSWCNGLPPGLKLSPGILAAINFGNKCLSFKITRGNKICGLVIKASTSH